MRSTDERMDAVLGRVRAQEAAARRRRQRAVTLGGGALSVVVVVAVGFGISTVMGDSAGASPTAAQLGLMGSVFSGSPALGYILVGLLGIALGAAVAAAACRLGHGKGGISVLTSFETASSSAKPQVAKIASESSDTNSRSAPDEEGRIP